MTDESFDEWWDEPEPAGPRRSIVLAVNAAIWLVAAGFVFGYLYWMTGQIK